MRGVAGEMHGVSRDTVDEAAAAWRIRLAEPSISARVRMDFERWLAVSPRHRAAFDAMERAWNAAQTEAGDESILALRQAALRFTPPPSPRRYLPHAAWAAALIAGVSLWAWRGDHLGNHFNPQTSDRSTSDPTLAVQHVRQGEYRTRVGERAILRLVDGTVVTLDTASRATFDLTGRTREIRLLAGRANFVVAPDKTKAFVVYAADRKITALGTAFDVRLDPSEVRVTLVEGQVAVDQLALDAGAASGKTLVRAKLEPGEQLVAAIGGGAKVQGTDIRRVTSWREGRLLFADEPLASAVAEMNRYTAAPIVLSDAAIGDLRISGVFRTGEPRAFAHALTEYFAVDAQDQGGAVVLRWRR